MKRIISLLLALVVFVGCASVLASCGAPEDAGPEIAVYLGDEVYDFDPTDYYVNSNAEQLMSMLFEPLFKISEKGKLEKAAAADYKVNEEDRTIVIELRETYWSDDTRVTAQDYVYAWSNRLLAPDNANPAAALLYDIENAVAVKSGDKGIYELGAVASGSYEITIKYRVGADCEQLLRNLASVATSPVKQSVVEDSETSKYYWTKQLNTLVTNGAFKVEEYDLDTAAFTLARNLGYHQNSSVVDYTDNVTPAKLISFLNGYGEELVLSYDDITSKTVFYTLEAPIEMREANKDKASKKDDLSTYTYVLNTENELLAIPEVRLALSLALDRASMAEAIVFGKAADSFVSASLAAKLYNGTERPISTAEDFEAAVALLESVKDKTKGLSKVINLAINNDEESIVIAGLAEAAWESLGFDVNVNVLALTKTTIFDSSTNENIEITDSTVQYLVKNASYGERDFDVLAVDWQMYSDDPFVALAAFSSSMNGLGKDFTTNKARTNISGWWSFDYDSYINAAYMAETEEERLEALRKAEEILLEASPIIPLIHNQNFSFQSDDISDVKADGFGNFVLTKATQRDYQKYLVEDMPEEEEEEETEE